MHRCSVLIVVIILLAFLMHNYDKIKMQFRQLWFNHTSLTREYLFAVAHEYPRVHVVTRLMKNQDSIGDFLGRFYGKDFGNSLANLLKQHIGLVSKVVDGGQPNDLLFKNGEQIADKLSISKKYMREYLDSTIAEFSNIRSDILNGTSANFDTYEKVNDAAAKISDAIVRRMSYLPWRLLH